MNNKNIYKLYQLMEYFNNKYNYQAVLISNNIKKDEVWLINKDRPKYKVIRISLENIDLVNYDIERKGQILKALSSRMMEDCDLLDILVGNNDVIDEHFPTISIDENYYDGINLDDSFPEIKNIIHTPDNIENDIKKSLNNINSHSLNLSRKRRSSLKGKSLATNILIAICIIIFGLNIILSNIYSPSTAHVVLGADYKMFTLGLRQFWRLITVAFSHASIPHLIMNMYSLAIVGTYINHKYGTKFYLLTLFLSILCGSLTNGILTPNSLSVGMSGGIYGLMVIYLINAYKTKSYNRTSFIYLIGVNLLINVMGNVAWQAHLGGAICGLVMYLIKESNYKQLSIGLLIILILLLGYKYVTIKTIDPIYQGTDLEVVKVFRDIGLKEYANNLTERLMKAYALYK